LRPVQAKSETLSQKYPIHKKRADRVSQVVKRLSSKHEPLSSNPRTLKIKTTKEAANYSVSLFDRRGLKA
jgi:hypothetical protein